MNEGGKICESCYGAAYRASKKSEGERGSDWPDVAMARAGAKAMLSLMRPPHVLRLSTIYKICSKEWAICGEEVGKKKHIKTLRRHFEAKLEPAAKLLLLRGKGELPEIVFCSRDAERFSTEDVVLLLSKIGDGEEESRKIDEVAEERRALARRYRQGRDKLEEGSMESWKLQEEVRKAPRELWASITRCSESYREARRRRSLNRRRENCKDGWPWNPKEAPNLDSVSSKEKMRAASRLMIAEMCVGLDGKSVGPLRSSFSHLAKRSGASSMINLMSRAGVTMGRKGIRSSVRRICDAQKRMRREERIRACKGKCLMGFCSADNCDCNAKHARLRVGSSHDHHETATQLTQPLRDGPEPIPQRPDFPLSRQLPSSAAAKDLILPTNPGIVDDWESLVWGLVVPSKEKLLGRGGGESFGSLLRKALVGGRKTPAV